MKKRPIIISALLCAMAGGSVATAQTFPADASGYLERGILMCSERNYQGCFDQMSHLLSLNPSASQRETALYYLCKSSLSLGNDETLSLTARFLDEFPASRLRTDVKMMVGDYYFNRSEYARALTEYASVDPLALSQQRTDEMSYRQGYSYLMLGEPETAASYFRMIQSKKEWKNAARFYLGYIAYSQKDYNTALQYFKGLDTSVAPANAAPYYEAQIYYSRADYSHCLQLVTPLISSGCVPEFLPECNRLAGESLYSLGRTDEALPYLWRYCAEVKSPAPSAFYILGVSEYDKGDYDAAVKLLQQSVGSHSAMEQSAWLYLGQAYLKRGDKSQALMAFENAYKVNYDRDVRETAFYNYAVARMDGGRVPFGNSVSLLESFLSEYPSSVYAPDVQQFIINGYMSDNDYTHALDAINRIKNPSAEVLRAKQRVLFVLGTREYSSGHVAEAITHLTEAKAVRHGDSSISSQCDLWLGDCYYSRRSYEEAARCYLAFLKSAPSSDVSSIALARYDLGYTRFAQERYSDAATDFNDALKLINSGRTSLPESLRADAISRIADCRYYGNDYAAAADLYTQAYNLNPAAGDYALYQTAIMKGLLKDHQGKVALLDQLASGFPTSGLLPQAMLEKAESQVAMNRIPQAVETYRKLVADYPSTSSGRNGYLQLAITYINSGDNTKGIETYREVITRFPSSEEARIAADDLKQIYASQGRLNELVAFLQSVPNAPSYEPSELERSAFLAAENAYINDGSTSALQSYIKDYPGGSSQATALYYLADAAWNAGKPAEAQSYATRVLLTYPDSEVSEDALLIKAQAESEMGKTEIAYSSFLELESHASGSNMLHDARLGLMRTAMDLGRYNDAVTYADKLLSSTATNSPADLNDIRFTRALANDRLGNHERAEKDWSSLAGNTSELTGAKSSYYLAQSLFDRGQTSRAKKQAEELTGSDTPHSYWLARGFILYSDILRKEGNTFEANEYLKSLRSNYPGTEADIFQMIDTRLKK